MTGTLYRRVEELVSGRLTEESFVNVVREMMGVLKAEEGWFAHIGEARDLVLRRVGVAGSGEVESIAQEDWPAKWATVLRGESYRGEGNGEEMGAPIQEGGRVLGAVMVVREGCGFGQEEADLMGRICRRLGRELEAWQARVHAATTEQAYKALVEGALDGIVSIDEQGRVLTFNPGAARMFGYEPEEIVGRNVSVLMPQPVSGQHRGYLERYRETGKRGVIGTIRQVTGMRKSGAVFPAELAVSEVRTPGQRLYIGTIRDISLRRQAEATLHALEQRHRAFLNAIPDLLFRIKDGVFIDCKAPSDDELAYSFDEFLGRHYREVLPGEVADLFERGAAEAEATGEVQLIEYRLPRVKDGERKDWESRIVPLGGQEFIMIAADVTVRKRAEVQLRQSNEAIREQRTQIEKQAQDLERALVDARAAAEAKSAFLASVSHEIRTPMNGILGMARLLLQSEMLPDHRDLVETIRNSGEALLEIINDILDFSKIDAGKLAMESRPFDLAKLLEETVDLLSPKAQEKQLKLLLRIDPELPRKVVGDAGRVRQVVLNLLGNAIKFTAEGYVFLQVAMGERNGDTLTAEFQVQDTGIGIPRDRVDRLFLEFSQVDDSTTRKYGGTGLGLAISKRLVEMMGGTIGVESEEGVGSRFYFSARLGVEGEGTESKAMCGGGEGRKVLLLDADPVSASILAEQVQSLGYEYEVVDSVEQLAALRGRRAVAAIIDMNFEGMVGVTGKLRQVERVDLPCIALMWSKMLGDGQNWIRHGFDGYFSRPLLTEDLSVVLDEMVNGRVREVLNRHWLRRRRSAPQESTERIEVTAKQARVLVVEDNKVNQKLIGRLLGRLGCEVEIAGNGLVAVQMWKRSVYDVILMDCQMPEMDGYMATAEIRRLEGGAGSTPIIALTADIQEANRERCREAGMTDFLSKPFPFEQLAEKLQKYTRAVLG